MAQQCERPACAEPAVVAYGFDPGRGVAWLEAFVAAHPHQGRLCRRHADAMVVPQGWWLEDRRSAEQLFASGPSTSSRPARRPWRPARSTATVVPLPLPDAPGAAVPIAPTVLTGLTGTEKPGPMALADPDDPETGPADASADGPAAEVVPAPEWTPSFAVDDDLDGLLNATSPLLSRAFGRVKDSGTRQRAPGA